MDNPGKRDVSETCERIIKEFKPREIKKRIKCSIKNQKKIMDSRTCLYRHLVPSFPRTKIS